MFNNSELVRRDLPVLRRDTHVTTVNHTLVEIVSKKKLLQGKPTRIKLYSIPSKKHRFVAFFLKTMDIAKR